MSGHQYATIADTVYFWFGANDTSGSGGDGATPLFDVREAGAAAGAIPLLSGTPTLLSHANYPAGCYEVAVAATVGNGFAADDTFGVFCTLAIDSQNPTGFVGSCTLTPHISAANVNSEVSDVLKTDTVAEMAQGAPPLAPTMEEILNYLYRKLRNKEETIANLSTTFADNGTTELFKSTLADNGTTFTKSEAVTGT
jgi:hypothetical protein